MLLSTMMVKKTAFSEWKNSLNRYNFFCVHLRQKLCANSQNKDHNLLSAKFVDLDNTSSISGKLYLAMDKKIDSVVINNSNYNLNKS